MSSRGVNKRYRRGNDRGFNAAVARHVQAPAVSPPAPFPFESVDDFLCKHPKCHMMTVEQFAALFAGKQPNPRLRSEIVAVYLSRKVNGCAPRPEPPVQFIDGAAMTVVRLSNYIDGATGHLWRDYE